MAPPRVSAVQQLEHDISRFSLSHSTRSNTKAQLLQPGEPLTANQIDLTAQLPGVRGRNEIGECRLVVEKHTPDHESIQAFFRQINNNKNTFDIITQNLDADAFQGAVRLLELKVLDVKVPELNDSDWSIYYAENIPAQDIEENRFPLKERLDLLKTTGCDLNSALSMAIQVQNLPFIKALTEIGVGHESLSPDRNNTMHVLCMKSNTMTLDEVINQIFLFAKTKAMNICECNMDGKTPIDMVISHHPTFLSTFEQHLRAASSSQIQSNGNYTTNPNRNRNRKPSERHTYSKPVHISRPPWFCRDSYPIIYSR